MDRSTSATASCRSHGGYAVAFPRHHSALLPTTITASFWKRLLLPPLLATKKNDRREGGIDDVVVVVVVDVLIVQCHSEGTLWRGLVPLLLTTDDRSTRAAAGQSEQQPEPTTTTTTTESPNNATTMQSIGAECREEEEQEAAGDDGGGRDVVVVGGNGIDATPALGDRRNHHHRRRRRDETAAAGDEEEEERQTTTTRQERFRRRARADDPAPCRSSRLAFTFLANRYRKFVRRISVTAASSNDSEPEDGDDASLLDWTVRRFRGRRCSNDDSVRTVLVLLPPNDAFSRSHRSNVYPQRSDSPLYNHFARSLIRHENASIRLTSLSAYVSTLGGGAFLCHYLSAAIKLARRQYCLALLRGDRDTAFRCRINAGYCFVHNGKVNRGRRVIRLVLRDVMGLLELEEGGSEDNKDRVLLLHHTPERELSELAIIRNMCLSALRFANHIKEAGLRDLSSSSDDGHAGGRSSPQGGILNETEPRPGSAIDGGGVEKKASATHDDFQRIRIVRDRKWG